MEFNRQPPPHVFPDGVPDGDTVVYGPDIADESTLRLLGNVEGRRILELGAGSGRNAVSLARQGAKVIVVDPDATKLERARTLADHHEVRIEFHHADPADIAFVRADTVDLVLTVHALAAEPDPDRVFRQAHRVLRSEASLVLSVPHPAAGLVDPWGPDPLRITRSWFDPAPLPGSPGNPPTYLMTFAALFGSLYRASFRVEMVLEPEAEATEARSAWFNPTMRMLPATLVVRARKLGL